MTIIEEIHEDDAADGGSSSLVVGGQDSELPKPAATTTQAHAEIERRARAASELRACDEKATFDRVDDADGPDPPFRSPAQRYLLYSVSHAEMPPIAKDPTNPGIRVYGLMESRDDCRAYAKEVSAADPTCSLLITDTHRWDVLARSPDRLADPHYKPAKLRRLAQAHAELRASTTAEFRNNVDSHRTGGKDTKNEETMVSEETREVRRILHEATWEQTVATGRKARTRLPGTLAIEDQRFMVVAFMRDLSPEVVDGDDDPEPAFMVLAAFATEKECDRYVRNVAADQVQDHDMDIVEMRQWLHPEQMGLSERLSTIYRDKELTEIMSQHKKDATQVSRFKQEQAALGRPVDIKDIGADAEAAVAGEASGGIEFQAELFGDDEAKASATAWDQMVDAALDSGADAGADAPVEVEVPPELPPLPTTRAGLRRMRVGMLRDHLEAMGLSTEGSKNTLVDRLWAEIQ